MRRSNGKRAESVRVSVRSQREVLRDVMMSAAECGSWLTLRELSTTTQFGEASISAQLRHLRKPRYGSFVVEKKVRKDAIVRDEERGAIWEYRLRKERPVDARAQWLKRPLRLLTATKSAATKAVTTGPTTTEATAPS
jgi:hypothetical protein